MDSIDLIIFIFFIFDESMPTEKLSTKILMQILQKKHLMNATVVTSTSVKSQKITTLESNMLFTFFET